MIQNQIIKKHKNRDLGENPTQESEIDLKIPEKLTFNHLTRLINIQKNNRKTIRKRIMIMRSHRKSRREEFSKKISEEFLKLFDGYMLF